jgi:hypothetical protein
MNPNMWNFQNIDSTKDYYVMSGGDDMGMVPVGGYDNYWRVMDRAMGGDGGVGTTGLTSAGVPEGGDGDN